MQHGTITIEGNEITIAAPPHVSIRLRRLFGGAQRYKAGVFKLSATPAQAYDLEWFRERHPLDIDPGSEARFRELVATHERKLAAIEAIEAEGYVPREFELALPPRAYQRLAADLAIKTGSLLLGDDLGLGKQQPVDTKVLTPSGYREIGLLRVGDMVIGSDGRPTAVTGVYPQGVKPSYRVAFSDGASVEAGAEHLWAVEHLCGGKRWERLVVTTQQLLDGARIVRAWPDGRRTTTLDLGKTTLYLPMLSGPVEFAPAAALPLPAYLVGQLVANGALTQTTASLTTHADDWPEIRATLEARGVEIGAVHTYGKATRAGIPGIMPRIRALGMDVLSRVKRIPETYLRASVADRIDLLHGLMDGDGSISPERSRVVYHTTSHGLAEDAQHLIEQLGGVASLRRYEREADGKPTEYQVRVRLPATIRPFTTRRKDVRFAPVKRTEPTRSVVSVTYVRDVESVCIAVAAPDRLYATEHAILTHNTVSAICTFTAPGALPALVVTMTHLTRQWEREIARFAPSLRVHRIRKGSPYAFSEIKVELDPVTRRRKVVKSNGVPDVLLINYHKLNGWVETLAGLVRTVVFDEGQELRHSGTKKYDAAAAIAQAADLRISCTATPIYNYGVEIFNVVSAIAPGQLGTRKEFLDEWCGEYRGDDNKARVSDPAALGTYLREAGLMLRRTRKDVGRELPALTVVRHVVECDEGRLQEATADVAELARRVLERIGTNLERMQSAGELDYRLRQATGIAKAPAVADFVRLLVEAGERVVLFGWHHECYAQWRDAFDRTGAEIPYVMFTGQESDAQKDAAREAFIKGTARVLIISLRAGAGLDGLQHVCRTVVFGELDWSPGVHAQDIGRVHRDGQTEPVMAYYLVAEEGSDPVIADVLGIKEAQAQGIVDPDKTGTPELTGASDDHIRKLAEDVLRRRGGQAHLVAV